MRSDTASKTVTKRRIGSLLGILKYMLHYKKSIAVILIAAISGNALALLIPNITGKLVDTLIQPWNDAHIEALLHGVLLIAGVAVVSWLLSVVQNVLMLNTAQNMVTRLRHDVFSKLMRLPVSYFDTRSKGDIISVVSVDIDNISDTVSSDVVTLISGVITVVGALTMMLTISPPLTLIFAVTVPAMFIAARIMSKRARILHRARKDCFGKLCGYTEEMITAQKTVKSYGLEEYNLSRFRETTADLKEKGARAEFQSSCMMPTMNGINNLNFTLICVFGAIMALGGNFSVGNISAFVLYSKRFAHPIVETANIINMFQTSLAACDRVFSILNADAEPDEAAAEHGTVMRTVKGDITLDNVNFSYREDTPVLQDVDVEIKQGQTIAVVGATGSGKTTLISLLLRFYDVTAGRILLDGKDIREYPLQELRRCFALVLQDSWLFEGTVYDNIGYAAPAERSTKEAIRQMCKDIKVDSFIQTLPDGYDTILYNDSGGLSQGQKQLLNIARA
ncbi:ABC transporter ATP-binding protein/permease, partial [Ruminococcaceae bacterium OttesenSCG-928-L11]|nr:ABC transporter ATP-binding protein/permease [Ruminococcaceae bacterium OttesenSCG-928-L11]